MKFKIKKEYLPVIFTVFAILSTVFIWTNSMQTSTESAQTSQTFVNIFKNLCEILKIDQPENIVHFVRKSAHFIEFLVQAFFISLAFIYSKARFRTKVIYVLFLGLFTACVDEFIQMFYDGRGSQVKDVFIDFTGVMISTVICIIIHKLRHKKIEKEDTKS